MVLHRNLLRAACTLRCVLPAALVLAGAGSAAAPAAGAAPTAPPVAPPASGIALVIGNASYSALPPLPACALSAHAVAAALRRLGFQVIEREDGALGQVDGVIGDFSSRLTAAPAAPAFAYLCGYAVGLGGRSFYLPASATLARPTDVLTQGVLVAPLLRVLASRSRAGVLALDLAARPDVPGPPDLGISGTGPVPAPLGLIVVREAAAADAPTPLATGLVAGLAGPQVGTDALFTGLDARLAKAGPAAIVVTLHPPTPADFLAGAPVPAPPAAKTAAQTPPATTPAPSAQASSQPASSQPASSQPASPRPPAPLPAEADMTDAQRRQVQTALSGLGYYDGTVDGIFGPDTRAAIRRFQHELHAPMTGILTAGQATTLVTRNLR